MHQRQGWVIGAGFEGWCGEGGSGEMVTWKGNIQKGEGNKRDAEDGRRCRRQRCVRGETHEIRVRGVIPGAAWQEGNKWIREGGTNVGWRQEVKELEDKAGERAKERTDENAGQVIIPPTFSPVDWSCHVLYRTHTCTHARTGTVLLKLERFDRGPVCSSLSSLFTRLVYSWLAVPPLRVSTSKFRAIVL